MLPRANTGAMQMHLDEISRNVAARAHAVVLMDWAGWHKTDKRIPPVWATCRSLWLFARLTL